MQDDNIWYYMCIIYIYIIYDINMILIWYHMCGLHNCILQLSKPLLPWTITDQRTHLVSVACGLLLGSQLPQSYPKHHMTLETSWNPGNIYGILWHLMASMVQIYDMYTVHSSFMFSLLIFVPYIFKELLKTQCVYTISIHIVWYRLPAERNETLC